MKGDASILERLNGLLADELTAINQYMVHSEMADNWGFERLHKRIEARAMGEMKHAEKLIGRILFLEGVPVVSTLNEIRIGADVPKQLENDHAAEMRAIKAYNEAIKVAVAVGDNATREVLDSILKDEDGHLDEIEAQQDQIAQATLPIFLGHQIKE